MGDDCAGHPGWRRFPLVWAGNKPDHEIEHPMAIVILGGLVTSTVLNLAVMPALYLAFGHTGTRPEEEEEEEESLIRVDREWPALSQGGRTALPVHANPGGGAGRPAGAVGVPRDPSPGADQRRKPKST